MQHRSALSWPRRGIVRKSRLHSRPQAGNASRAEGRGSGMPRSGSINSKWKGFVLTAAAAPLVVAAFAVAALVVAGGQWVGIAAVLVIGFALAFAIFSA